MTTKSKLTKSEFAGFIAKWIGSVLLTVLGTGILAAGIHFFLVPYTISPGGVSGFAIIIERLTGIPVYAMNLVINVPLFIFGAKLLGKRSAILTLIATLALSGVLAGLGALFPEPIDLGSESMMLAAIFGGVLVGLGLGIVFKVGGTTGGTDLAGAIINYYYPGFSIAKGMAAIDFIIVIMTGVVTKLPSTALYSIIAVFFCMRIPDIILDGFDHFKGFFIITNQPDEIGQALMDKLGRGVTILKGAGMYSKQDRPILLCVVSRAQLSAAKEIIADIDEKAFIMVAEMKEVFGEGFKLARDKD